MTCGGLRTLLLAAALGIGRPLTGFPDDPGEIAWLSGRAFDRAIEQPVSVFRERAEVRETLTRLAGIRRTACLLDRRIDPSSPVTLRLTQVPFLAAIDETAEQIAATTGRLGSVVLIGRPEELDRLLTHEALRKEELKSDLNTPSARRVELTRGRTVLWRELDRPIDILDEIARQWSLTLEGREHVPHDLWAAGVAVDVDATEALSLVLGQFDLTFQWTEGSRGIRIIPAASEVTVERTHRAISMPRPQAVTEIHTRWPDRPVEIRGQVIAVTASVLEHREISRLLGELPAPKPIAKGPLPLDRRRFPVRIIRKPVGEILRTLKAQGIDLHFDVDALRTAGVDLDQLITAEHENATAAELLDSICRPAGLRFEIDGDRVNIFPASTLPQ